MKILYDISVLGWGYPRSDARTGVARVVENVAEQLLLKNCKITFCSDLGIEGVDSSLQYLSGSKALKNTPFSKPHNFEDKLRSYKRKEQVLDRILNKREKNLAEKIARRLQYKALNLKDSILEVNDNLIDRNDVKNADIYHSPFLRIPKQIVKAGKKSVFLTSHDIIALLFPHFVVPLLEKLVKEIVGSITPDTWVLCVSESTRNDLLNYLGPRIDPNKAVVTYLATSDLFYVNRDISQKEKIKAKYNIPEPPYILSVCTLEPRKNLTQVIKAFSNLIRQENIADLNLVLVGGSGWLFEDIFNEIQSAGDIKKRIVVTGYVEDEDLSFIYSNALMFVYPSFYEGFGLPPLEAMKCGTPVITSNTSSLPEVVGDAGIMVSPADLDSLCDAMFTMYTNSNLRKLMIERSIERAKRFSWERCADETIQAYKASIY